MSFGIQVDTTQGLANLVDLKPARLLGTQKITVSSGSNAAPTGTINIFVRIVQNTGINVQLTNGNLVWSPINSFFAGQTVEIDIMFFGGPL
jgi:hypothetical protein